MWRYGLPCEHGALMRSAFVPALVAFVSIDADVSMGDRRPREIRDDQGETSGLGGHRMGPVRRRAMARAARMRMNIGDDRQLALAKVRYRR